MRQLYNKDEMKWVYAIIDRAAVQKKTKWNNSIEKNNGRINNNTVHENIYKTILVKKDLQKSIKITIKHYYLEIRQNVTAPKSTHWRIKL